MRVRMLLAGLIVAIGAAVVHAQPAAPPPAKLAVYTKPIEPFSFQRDGRALGFSIDLWERVAREAGVQYELHWVKSVQDLIDALHAHQADVAIAAISITSEREAVADFSTPYYESGLGILVDAQGQSAFSVLVQTLVSWSSLKVMLLLVGLLAVTAHLIWFFERRHNPEQFPRAYWRGVWEASWWALSTILSGGCEGKGPIVVVGRIVAMVWMLICIVVVTYLTAAITTVMTVNQLTSDIRGASDLPGLKVATVKSSTAERYLRDHGARVESFPTIDEAYAALDRHEVKAVVYDEPILAYHLKVSGHAGQQLVGRLFERQNYGIGLQENSPLRKPINSALLKLREQGVLDELRAKWFGDED